MLSFRLFAAPAAAALALFAAFAVFAAATPPAENNVARISDFIGTTACGKTNVNSFHSNAVGVAGNVTGICGRKIRLYYKHKSVVAYIVDSCGPVEKCGGDGNVILSRKAFGALANVDKGHIQLKKHWTFSD